jgi:hypothetical protein
LEWLYCYDQFASNPRVDVIGLAYFDVPKDLKEAKTSNFDVPDEAEAARLTLLQLIQGGMGARLNFKNELEIYYRGPVNKPIHILGLRHFKALKFYKALPSVRSIDTSFATQLGVEGRILRPNSIKPSFKVNFIATPNLTESILMRQNQYRFQQYSHSQTDSFPWEEIDSLTLGK